MYDNINSEVNNKGNLFIMENLLYGIYEFLSSCDKIEFSFIMKPEVYISIVNFNSVKINFEIETRFLYPLSQSGEIKHFSFDEMFSINYDLNKMKDIISKINVKNSKFYNISLINHKLSINFSGVYYIANFHINFQEDKYLKEFIDNLLSEYLIKYLLVASYQVINNIKIITNSLLLEIYKDNNIIDLNLTNKDKHKSIISIKRDFTLEEFEIMFPLNNFNITRNLLEHINSITYLSSHIIDKNILINDVFNSIMITKETIRDILINDIINTKINLDDVIKYIEDKIENWKFITTIA